MFMRSVWIGAILVICPSAVVAGCYSTIDAPEEMLYSRDFLVFAKALDVLNTIRVERPATNPPIRRRYLLIENIAGDKLETLEQKLNYGAVLIRRGRAVEAVRYLGLIAEERENRDNFVVQSQYATALFLTANRDFDVMAPRYMKKALDKWPAAWADLKDEQKAFVDSLGWTEFELMRYRRCEELFKLFIDNRLRERKLLDQKKPVEETVDPIFLDAQKKPIRFLNDRGEYEAGKIAAADKEQLPRDSVELVEQLLLWMPGDDRLLWLLAETLNASAMEHQTQKGKSTAVLNAYRIYDRLTNFNVAIKFARQEIASRKPVLQDYVDKNPVDVIELPPEDPFDVKLTSREWWWRQVVMLIIGLAVGMFAIWQLQELRRRRQARSAKG